MKLTHKISWEDIHRQLGSIEPIVILSFNNCWWKIGGSPYVSREGIPCDPLNSVLQQFPLENFLDKAKQDPGFYGKFGLATLLAAYHGNLVNDAGEPTCFETWDEYSKLLDMEEENV